MGLLLLRLLRPELNKVLGIAAVTIADIFRLSQAERALDPAEDARGLDTRCPSDSYNPATLFCDHALLSDHPVSGRQHKATGELTLASYFLHTLADLSG
jgi:hypothetical protein